METNPRWLLVSGRAYWRLVSDRQGKKRLGLAVEPCNQFVGNAMAVNRRESDGFVGLTECCGEGCFLRFVAVDEGTNVEGGECLLRGWGLIGPYRRIRFVGH